MHIPTPPRRGGGLAKHDDGYKIYEIKGKIGMTKGRTREKTDDVGI